jgi:fumarylacetoacetate (FAA) hydrolase
MKLASLKSGRDGRLVVVHKALNSCVSVTEIAPTLQSALDNWSKCEPLLRETYLALEANKISFETFDPSTCASPLPRAFHWVDGSAYVNHVELVRKARNAEMPKSFWSEPLVYQGGSDTFLDPMEPIQIAEEAW